MTGFTNKKPQGTFIKQQSTKAHSKYKHLRRKITFLFCVFLEKWLILLSNRRMTIFVLQHILHPKLEVPCFLVHTTCEGKSLFEIEFSQRRSWNKIWSNNQIRITYYDDAVNNGHSKKAVHVVKIFLLLYRVVHYIR